MGAKERIRLTDEHREKLLRFADFAQGDPRLSAWEEAFVGSMRVVAGNPAYGLTEKQVDAISRIIEKLAIQGDTEPNGVC